MASAPSQANGYAGQPQPGSPERQSSFVGLPPIRRTSTFGLLGKDGDSDSIASDKDNVPPVPPMPQYITAQGTGEQSPMRFGSPGLGPSQQQQGPPPQLQQHQHQQFMQQGAPQHYMNGGQPGGPQMGPPNGMPPNMAGRGFGGPGGPGAPGGPQMQQQQQQQPGFGRGGPPGMPGQPFPPQAGGNPIAQFPMGGKWKLEESHLQQPLNQPKNNRSSPQMPQPGYFAGDKETESQLALPPGAGMPQRRNNSGMPPISAQRWPTLFQEQGQAGPQGQPGPMGPPGQPGQFMQQGPPPQNQQQQQQQPFEPNKYGLTRTSTNEITDGEKGHARKVSSGLMSKFSRGRANSNAEDQSSIHNVPGNDASSIVSAETDSGKKESFFGSLARRSTAALDQMKSPSTGTQQQQQQPPQAQQQQQPQQQQPERRGTFFGGGNQPLGQSKPKSSLNLVRTATQESAAPSQATQQSSGKKRLSGLVSGFGEKLKNVGSSKEDDQPAKTSPAFQQGGPNGQFPPQGQQPPASAQLGPGAPGVPGQGAPGPQGQQRLMQGTAPGQQFAPGQGPPPTMMGSRGPPGWAPQQGQQQSLQPSQPQGPPQGLQQGQPQNPQQRQFSGQGPLPPQGTGPQPGMPPNMQQQPRSGQPQGPQQQAPPQGLQQKPSLGSIRDQTPKPQQDQSENMRPRAESQGQQNRPSSSPPPVQLQDPQARQSQNFNAQQLQKPLPGSPGPQQQPQQGQQPGQPQGPGPNPQQRLSQLPPGQQQQGPQQGRPQMSGPGPNGPQFGQPGQQGPLGQQFPPGQQPPPGFQGQFRPQGPPSSGGQFGPGGPGGPGGPPGPAIRPPTGNSGAPPGQAIPQSATAPQQQTAARKASGFLGGLMNKLKGGDSESHGSQPAGQQPPQGQQFPNQQRPPSQSVSGRPFGQQMPGQPGQQPPAGLQARRASEAGPMMGMGRGQLPPPGQLQPGQRQVSASSIGLPMQGASPGPQPGQAIGQRPGMPPQQNSQTTVRPSGEFNRQNPLGSNPVTPSAGLQQDPLAPPKMQGSPQLAGRPSQERLNVTGLSTTPTRKPVGSAPIGHMGPDRSSVVSAHTVSTVTQPNSAVSRPEGAPTDASSEAGESRSAASPAQSIPQFSSPDAVGLGRQPSLPTPSQTPAPQPSSPSAPSAPSHAPSQASPRPSEAETASASVADSQEAQHGTPQPPGARMPEQGVAQSQQRPFGAPGQQQFAGQALRQNTGSPVPSHQESGGISKFFGKKNTGLTGQNPGQGQPQEKKEKASSKLLGAFRRQPKQADQQPASTQPPQQVPQGVQGFQGQGRGQMPMNYQQQTQVQMQAQNQLGRGQMPLGQMPPHMQAGRGQGPPPQGQFPGGPPPMMAGRGQMPPGQMPPGQIPPYMQAGRGQMQGPPQGFQQGPPQGFPPNQAGRGQPPMPQQQQQFAGQQRTQSSGPNEQQYAPVPIPRGYETVHGYGQPNMQAPTGYNIGRQYSSPTPPGWNPQWGPPPPHVMQQFAAQQQQMMGQPPQQQQQMPPNQFGRPEPATAQSFQSGSTVGPPGGERQPAQPMLPQGTGSAPMQTQMSPPPLQDARSAPPAQNPQNVHGGPPAIENKTLLQHEPSQPDNSPTISPQVSAPVTGMSAPVNMSHNVSPPAAEDQVLGRPQVGPIDTGRADMVSPPNVPIPDSATTFSPVNPAAGRLSNPPLPTVTAPIESADDTEAAQQHGKAPAQHRLSDIRLMASQSTERSASASPDHHVQGQQLPPQQNGHSNLLAARAQNMSPVQNGLPPQTPTGQQQSNNMNINVVQANGHKPEDHHDYYDATPRVKPSAQGQEQEQQQQAQRQQEAHNSPTMNKGKAAAVAGGLAAGGVMGTAGVAAAVSDDDLTSSAAAQKNGVVPNGMTNGDSSTGSSSTPANGIESPPLDRDAEEKIVVEEAYELPAVNDNSEDLLIMSATSYPGQEWNPYGAGEFGDFEP